MMSNLFNDDYLVCSPSYSEIMNGTVLPWLSEKENATEIIGADNRPLYCVSYMAEDPLATVVIVHGFTENAFKYAELIWSLLHCRYSVIAFDQRGHGRSWRDPDILDLSVTHVDHFSDYTDDLSFVCDTFFPVFPKPFFVFGHSMGGAVKSYSGPEDFNTSCATDPVRFDWYDQIKVSRKEFQNSVPSYRWSYEALHVTEKILAPNAVERISCPVLLFSAESDFSVLQAPQKTFIGRVPYGQYEYVIGSRHEIFRSKNEVLFPWWHKVLCFYQSNVSSFLSEGGSSE